MGKHKHGMANRHPLYRKWQDMKKRCYNPKVDRYKSYGAVGITVCDEWKNDFEVFYNWCISNGWWNGSDLQLDRIDVNGNYEPSNCRFTDHIEQGFNKKNTFYVTVNGESISLAKLMHLNNKSDKYHTVWVGLNRDKRPIDYYIEKLGLKV